MAQRILGSSAAVRHVSSSSSSSLLAAATVVGGATTIIGLSRWYSSDKTQLEEASLLNGKSVSSRLEVHLMDKIQQKDYLASARDAIPSTLRILAIDLPEMRTHAFQGDCRLSHDKIFADDVAAPKVVVVRKDRGDNYEAGNVVAKSKDSTTETDVYPEKEMIGDKSPTSKGNDKKKNKTIKLKVSQKALVKSLVQCHSSQSQQRVGVELLEASVSDLNKYKLRKTHQVGGFKYDPGKYYTADGKESDQGTLKLDTVPQTSSDASTATGNMKERTLPLGVAGFDDELEAPWNQYAWAEELRLRINGQVGFDAPLEKASRWNRYLFGQAYKITIDPVYHFWEWPLPTFAKSNPDGVDGRYRTNCRASNKPHAVIANGAALQKVPSSMRLLQKMCKKADVPLFVIHDPRVWGGNTHQSLPEALRDMRSTIKGRVISRALEQQGSTAFTRGRMLGQMETEAKWQVKEQKRKSKEIFRRLGRSVVGGKKMDGDWSQLDSIRLERRLVERGVIKEKTSSDGEGSSVIQKTYTEALIDLAKRCVHDVEEQQLQAMDEPARAPDASSPTAPSELTTAESSAGTPRSTLKI